MVPALPVVEAGPEKLLWAFFVSFSFLGDNRDFKLVCFGTSIQTAQLCRQLLSMVNISTSDLLMASTIRAAVQWHYCVMEISTDSEENKTLLRNEKGGEKKG